MEHTMDALTRELTAFESFRDLLDTHASYRPTILPRDTRHIDLADAFDAAMADRGDARRAYRGLGSTSTITTNSPEGFLSIRAAGVPAGSGLVSDWLRVIWNINGASKADGSHPEQWIGSPIESHANPDGSFVEEYPDFRVVLRHTAWGCGENSGTVMAKTAEAEVALRSATSAVVGYALPMNTESA